MIFEFKYEVEAKPWKAPIKGKNVWYSPEPYTSFRTELTEAIKVHCCFTGNGFHQWKEAETKDSRYALSLIIVKKRKDGDLTNILKGIEDCIQLSGVLYEDERIDRHVEPFLKRQCEKGEKPYIWFRLELLK